MICIVALVSFYSTADCSTTASRTCIPFSGRCWAQRQLHNGIRYVPVVSELMNSLSSVEGVLGFMLAIFYSIVDYSTTTLQILIHFVGGCWARRQLRNGVRYVPIASKLRNSLSSVEGLLARKLVLFNSTADYSTTTSQI